MGDENLKDLQSYPVLTSEVGHTGTSRPNALGTPGTASLGQVVESALREVLGWRPRASDPKGFVAALTQAFSAKEREGSTEWMWIPRSYAVQQDMGAVTGAQASIYARAKAALDQSLPLLDGLTPLRADSDAEDSDAIRAIVRTRLTELVYELGQAGGPRVERVDELFNSLLGAGFLPGSPDPAGTVNGLLGQMRAEFGFERVRVNTIEEEQNLTNFVILVDHVTALKGTWDAQRPFFERAEGTNVFLGTQLVLLSRALAVVAESVQETYFAMDSVFLGPAERQTTRLPGDIRLTVAELLSWIEHFATDEAPRIIREGGKDGVIALQQTVEQLRGLVEDSLDSSFDRSLPSPPPQARLNPTRGFHTPRVQRALEELHTNLKETTRLFNQIKRLPAPEVVSVHPPQTFMRRLERLTIDGENFQSGTAVTLVKGLIEIPGKNRTIVSATEINATFDLTDREKAPAGLWDVVVTNEDGSHAQLEEGFEIIDDEDDQSSSLPPLVTSVDPSKAPSTGDQLLTISGENFHADVTVELVSPQGTVHLSPKHVSARDARKIAATFDLRGQSGEWDVVVTNQAARQSTTKSLAFTVEEFISPPPIVRSVQPAEAGKLPVKLTIQGENFPQSSIVTFQQENSPVTVQGGVDTASVDTITVSFPALEMFPPDKQTRWAVIVTNPETGQSSEAQQYFTVNKPGKHS